MIIRYLIHLHQEMSAAGRRTLHWDLVRGATQGVVLAFTGLFSLYVAIRFFDASEAQKTRLCDYLGHKVYARTAAWQLIRLAMTSVAKVCMIPMQDILNLGEEARMNLPAKARGNWQWRMTARDMGVKHAKRLQALTELTGRV